MRATCKPTKWFFDRPPDIQRRQQSTYQLILNSPGIFLGLPEDGFPAYLSGASAGLLSCMTSSPQPGEVIYSKKGMAGVSPLWSVWDETAT